MSDTVYEKAGLSFTRFWGGTDGDCIQVTISTGECYATMTLAEFKKMVRAVNKNVKETKGAWWHNLTQAK